MKTHMVTTGPCEILSLRLQSAEGVTRGPNNKWWDAGGFFSFFDKDKADTILNPSQISGGCLIQ